MSRSILIFSLVYGGLITGLLAQKLPPVALDDLWIKMISQKADSVIPQHHANQKILVFSLATGYQHWVIPHTNEMIKIIGEKSGTFEVEITDDIWAFEKQNLKKYDAVVLNNSCPQNEGRNIFLDVMKSTLSERKAKKKAAHLEDNLLEFVKSGGGLVVLHGGITMLNDSQSFSDMVGASFDYHPPQQEFESVIINPDHPITAPFDGKPLVVVDEPYFLNGAYDQFNFEPLLSFDPVKLHGVKSTSGSEVRYNAWIKSYGNGKVFFSAPSHNAQTFSQPGFLGFIYYGIKYVIDKNDD